MVLSAFEEPTPSTAKSAKHPETLVGEGLSGVTAGGGGRAEEARLDEVHPATLADFRWSLWLSTPEGKNWLYELWR